MLNNVFKLISKQKYKQDIFFHLKTLSHISALSQFSVKLGEHQDADQLPNLAGTHKFIFTKFCQTFQQIWRGDKAIYWA